MDESKESLSDLRLQALADQTIKAVIVSFCGTTRPAPPTSSKEQKINLIQSEYIFHFQT